MREGHTHKKKFHSFDALYPTILFPCPDVMCWFDILSTPIVFFLRFFFFYCLAILQKSCPKFTLQAAQCDRVQFCECAVWNYVETFESILLIIKLKFDGCYIFEGEISESCAESSMDVRPGRYTVLTFCKLCLRRLMPRKDKKATQINLSPCFFMFVLK